jgi:hypothetical protein
LERGRFIWPNVESGAVAITPAQLSSPSGNLASNAGLSAFFEFVE